MLREFRVEVQANSVEAQADSTVVQANSVEAQADSTGVQADSV